MEYKSLDFVGLFSVIFGAISVLGLAGLTFGPWAEPSGSMARLVLTFSWIAFWVIAKVAGSVRALLGAQADQIAALQRQLAERQPTA
jgi:hypothetical protein